MWYNNTSINVKELDYKTLNDKLRDGAGDITLENCCGQRFIAAGYAMRGGKIFIKGTAGYRAGIHMKAYKEKVPVMVIGGTAGSFLGEFQAGGVINEVLNAPFTVVTPDSKNPYKQMYVAN